MFFASFQQNRRRTFLDRVLSKLSENSGYILPSEKKPMTKLELCVRVLAYAGAILYCLGFMGLLGYSAAMFIGYPGQFP